MKRQKAPFKRLDSSLRWNDSYYYVELTLIYHHMKKSTVFVSIVMNTRHKQSKRCNMEIQPITKIFDILYSAYGPQRWWPGEGQFEIILGAILTQNTTWHNAALAIANLAAAKLLEPNAFFATPPEDVKTLIAPAGYFNVKYTRIRNFLEYLKGHDMELERFSRLPVDELREELLEVNGIGPETADSILLYAFERRIFVVDAYTRRLFSRLGYKWMEKAPYTEIQSFFMEELSPDTKIYNEYHALVVFHCKDTCRKTTPLCLACTLSAFCPAHRTSEL